MPSLSVLISTVRFQTLPHTVQSLLGQTFSDWELLVADQSGTAEIGDYLRAQNDPRIRHLPQQQRGLSHGRNAGIRAAAADILVFTDDDCEAAPEWLAAIHALFAADKTDLLFGPVVAPPSYRPGAEFCPAYPVPVASYYSWDSVARDIGTGIGANMSLHRRVVEKLGAFDPVLGAGSAQIPSAEETDYVLRALAHGLRVYSAPLPPIVHTYGVRPGAQGKELERRGNFGVGAVQEKMLRGPYREAARPHLDRLYHYLRRQVILNLLRGRRRQLGIVRLRALRQGRAYVRRHFTVSSDALLVPKSGGPALTAAHTNLPV